MYSPAVGVLRSHRNTQPMRVTRRVLSVREIYVLVKMNMIITALHRFQF